MWAAALGNPFRKRHTCVVYWPKLLLGWIFLAAALPYGRLKEDLASILESWRGPLSQQPQRRELNEQVRPNRKDLVYIHFWFLCIVIKFDPPALTWLLPTLKRRMQLGLDAGVACCVHKLIAVLIVVLACLSLDRVSQIPTLARRRHVSSTFKPIRHYIVYHMTVIWGNIGRLAARGPKRAENWSPRRSPTLAFKYGWAS